MKANSASSEMCIPKLSQDIYFENSESCCGSSFMTQELNVFIFEI